MSVAPCPSRPRHLRLSSETQHEWWTSAIVSKSRRPRAWGEICIEKLGACAAYTKGRAAPSWHPANPPTAEEVNSEGPRETCPCRLQCRWHSLSQAKPPELQPVEEAAIEV